MSLVSFGDLAQSGILNRRGVDTKREIATLSREVTTGQTADLTRATRAHLGPVLGIDASLARIEAFRLSTSETGQVLGGIQTAISTIDRVSGDLSGSLLAAVGADSQPRLVAAGEEALAAFGTAVTALNARMGDRSIFAGAAFQSSATESAADILARLQSLVAGLTTAAQIETAVAGWFDSPTGFAVESYLGDDPMGAVQIGPGEAITNDVTARDPALIASLKSLALGALIGQGALSGQPQEQAALARAAATSLLETQTDRALLSARVGTLEARTESTRLANEAERTALGLARNAIAGVDEYEVATRLQEAQGQLDRIFAITARMSRLSLLEYLR